MDKEKPRIHVDQSLLDCINITPLTLILAVL
jgi:hypothetical protein